MKTLVILPTYNEAENLPKIVPEILRYLPNIEESCLLIVDDHSPDGTGEIADSYSAQNPAVKVLHRNSKLGLGSAYVEGFGYALKHNFETIVQMDADFSHLPSYLPQFFQALGSADVAIGSRYIAGGGIQGWPYHRLLLSRFANLYARAVLGVSLTDLTGGFRCFRAKALTKLDFNQQFPGSRGRGRFSSRGYSFQIELNYRFVQNGFRFAEIPIIFPDRTLGRSKMSIGVIWEAFCIVWKLRFLS